MTVYPSNSGSFPVEPKVWAGTILAVAASVIYAILNAVQADSSILAPLPDWAQFIMLAAVPPLAVFFGAYSANHQYRQGERVG